MSTVCPFGYVRPSVYRSGSGICVFGYVDTDADYLNGRVYLHGMAGRFWFAPGKGLTLVEFTSPGHAAERVRELCEDDSPLYVFPDRETTEPATMLPSELFLRTEC